MTDIYEKRQALPNGTILQCPSLSVEIMRNITHDRYGRRVLNRRSAFMEATKGYSAHAVAISMESFTTGIDWRGSTKGHIAEAFAIGDRRIFKTLHPACIARKLAENNS